MPDILFKKWERYKSKLEISMNQSEIQDVLERLMLYKDFLMKKSDFNDFLNKSEYSKKDCKLIHKIRKKIRKDNVLNTLCRD